MSDDDILALARSRLGRVLRGKYRLDRVIGIGGMAVVYAATHRNKKRFAIKMLHPELSMRETIRTRFLREGYVANSVEHPGAVAVLDDDVAEDGSAFVVMELLSGVGIDHLWENNGKRVPLATALSIGDALLDVLAAAHAKGIVHRDIKPANLFLSNDGHLAVLDFGIARLHDETSTSATQTGAMMGTPAYMAPEQALAEAHNVSEQSDLWSVGATLFTLLTGELVHVGENQMHFLVNAATKKAREISSMSGEVPKPVALVIDKALAFDKKDRWATAKEMREALQRACVESTGAPIGPLPKTERVTGLEETIASDPDVARYASHGSNLGFDPTVDSAAISAVKIPPLSTAAALAGTKPSPATTPPPAAHRARWLALAGVVVVAAGAFGIVSSRGAPHGAAPLASASSAPASTPRPGRPPATPVAAAAFEAAIQADHDGNLPEVERSLSAALASDPALGAAQLRLAFFRSGDREADAHADYQKALDHRATLGEIDSALLDAWEPRFRDPPDRAERTRRMADVAKRYPKDVFVQMQLADSLEASSQSAESLAQANRTLALDPRYVPAMALKIEITERQGNVPGARQLADECVKASASAVACIQRRMTMSYEDGRCADLKADARHLIAIDPTSQQGYAALADAMASLGEPIESVAEALRRSDAHVADPDARHLSELGTKELLALMTGDLRAAESADAEAVAYAASRPSLEATDEAIKQINLVLEQGDAVRARALIKALRAQLAAAGMGEHDLRVESELATYATRAGAMTRDQLHAEQDRLRGFQKEADEHRGGKTDPFRTWGWIYANDIEDDRDAADALTALSKAGGVDPRFARVAFFAHGLGAMYAFAGQASDAIPYLEASEASCYQLVEVLDFTRDWYAMGTAREQMGDVAGARAAYQKVLDRWGSAKPKSVTAEKARARLAALSKK